MIRKFVVFGFSHFLGDIFDCIESVGGLLECVVLNVSEQPLPGRPGLVERLERMPYPVEILDIGKFDPEDDWNYVIGFSGKQMVPLLEKLRSLRFSPLIHARSIIQSGASVKDGVIVDAGAIVGPWAKIGRHTILNRGSSVGHDCDIGPYSFLAPSATLCSHVRIGENVKVGANAVILPDVHIGNDVVIGAGAVVRKNVPDGVMVAGVPAVIKKSKGRGEV